MHRVGFNDSFQKALSTSTYKRGSRVLKVGDVDTENHLDGEGDYDIDDGDDSGDE